MSKWWETLSLEELDALERQLSSELATPHRYKPGMYLEKSGLRLSLGDEFVKKIEEEGDEEDALKKMLRKGLRQPGTTKSRVEAYLKRVLEKAEEEGRL